ncbi:MAG: hypothetical protein JWO67_6210 [Streptosporangiaceae bacterium]|nr:hypothetical protein [Streptosporangiaceae bacterium]
MKAIQIILATTATAGTIAIGGAALAMTGGSHQAAPAAANAAAPARPKVAMPAVPAGPANCLETAAHDATSKVPAKLQSKVDAEKLKSELDAHKPGMPAPADLRSKAAAGAHEAAKAADPKAATEAAKKATDAAGKAAKDIHAAVPDCVPTNNMPKGAAQSAPAAHVPAAPALGREVPKLPKFSCDSLTPAVQRGSTVEHSITTPGGLKFVATKTRTLKVKGQEVCAKTQEWKGAGNQWLKVERLKGAVSADQLRQAFKLPAAQPQPTTMGQATYWKTVVPSVDGGGMFWSPAPGSIMYITAGPALQYRLQDIATQLHQVK